MWKRCRHVLKTKHFRFSFSKISSILVHLWGSFCYFLSETSENKIHLIYLREQTVKMCRHIGAKETSRREQLLLYVKSQKLRQLLAITYNNRKSTDEYDRFTKKKKGKYNFFLFPSVFCIAQADDVKRKCFLWLNPWLCNRVHIKELNCKRMQIYTLFLHNFCICRIPNYFVLAWQV